MKLSFLDSIPYICEQWAKVVARTPESPFIAEEVSERSFTRQQVDELSARVYGWLLEKGIGNRVCGFKKGEVYDVDIMEALSMKKPFEDELYDILYKTAF